MDELVLMIESESINTEALCNLKEEKTFDPEIWEKAVKEVTGRVGFELETSDGDEAQLVDNVMQEVVKTNVKQKILKEQC